MTLLKTERLDNGNLMVSVAIEFRRGMRGQCVISSPGSVADECRDSFLLAVARGRRWQRLLDEGAVAGIRELGERIGREPSYVARIIRLSNLAPEIIERVVGRGCPEGLGVNSARKAIPELWSEQVAQFLP